MVDSLKILSDVGLHMRNLARSIRGGVKSSEFEEDELPHMINKGGKCGEQSIKVAMSLGGVSQQEFDHPNLIV